MKLREFSRNFGKENVEKNGYLLETSRIFLNFWLGKIRKKMNIYLKLREFFLAFDKNNCERKNEFLLETSRISPILSEGKSTLAS